MEKIPFINLKQNHEVLSNEIETAVIRVLRSGWYILGQEVQQFEAAFAAYHNVNHAISVANGTDAIEIALLAYDIGQGDEVITVSHTAMPTVTAIEQTGAKPVLVDISPETYLMNVQQVENAITIRTKAIIPVHLYGQPVQIDTLQHIAEKHNLLLLEDCAQAHGARYKGQLVGTFGHIATFSFYPTKNLGAYGDAGAIITNDDTIAKRLGRIRNYGQETRYQHIERGVNSRMDDIQAAILNVKLGYLNQHNDIRRELAAFYSQNLRHVICPIEESDAHHVYHLYVIRHPKRDELQTYLAENGVQTIIHYPVPIHKQASHQDLGYDNKHLAITETITSEILSLPLHTNMQRSEQQRVIELVNEFGEQHL